MGSPSPLGAFFGLTPADGAWHLGLRLAFVAGLGLLWVLIRGRESGRRFAGVMAFLAVAIVCETLMPWLPRQWHGVLGALILTAFLFALVRTLVVAIDLVARSRRADFSTIFRDLLTLFLYAVVILIVLRVTLAVDVTPLIATSAVVTAVIGFALQETLGNVFSGLSLQVEQPFAPGDWVRFGNYLGRVQGIGWRSTRLVTRNLELLEVPNGVLAREVITNYRGNAMGDELYIGVSYKTAPNRMKEVVREVLAHNPEVVKTPAPMIAVADYGDFAVKYRIRFWMVDYGRQDQVRDAIMTSIWYAFRRHGIEIPYPIRTLHLHGAAAEEDAETLHRERIVTLKQVDFLRELEDGDLAVVATTIREVAFGRGEVVCHEGDPGETLYIVRRGTVEITARSASGGDTHVADLAAPAFFGEMSLLTGEPRTATVRAKTDAELLVVEREGFEQLFRTHPTVAEGVSQVLAARQSQLRARRELVQTGESPETVSRRLLLRMRAIFKF